MNRTIVQFLLSIFTLLTVSCDDDFNSSADSVGVECVTCLPDGISAAQLTESIVTFKNLSSGTVTEFRYNPGDKYFVLPGIYDVEFKAETVNSAGNQLSVRGIRRSCQILSTGVIVRLDLYCNRSNDDLIIVEIFFTGTLQNSGNQYNGDDYVKLYNNTDHVIYADGITLFESKFLTTQNYGFTPDIMDVAVTVDALYTIPGSGKEHPVMPGEYVILADVAIDHRQANPNSFSLTHADWEWYDVSTKPNNLDIDNPDVPNLDKLYCYTQSFWILHNRGFKAYGIARIPVDRDEYLNSYRYDYDYEIVSNAGTFPMSQSALKLPNEWVADVVNCSVKSEWQWNVTSPKLDSGWAWCGTIDKDKTRFFHAVRRKLLYVTPEGRAVFRDTDNSTEDFNSHVTPSEIELQHTVTGLGEGNATRITYDGVTEIIE